MAKKFLSILYVFLFVIIIIFSGCEKDIVTKKSKSETQAIAVDFSADFVAQYNSNTYRGRASCTRQGVITMNISLPETLNGLCIKYYSSEMEIQQDNLICSADEAYLPQESFPSFLKAVFDGIRSGRYSPVSSENSERTYSMSLPQGNCLLKTEDNILIAASVNRTDFNIEFDNVTLNND